MANGWSRSGIRVAASVAESMPGSVVRRRVAGLLQFPHWYCGRLGVPQAEATNTDGHDPPASVIAITAPCSSKSLWKIRGGSLERLAN